MDLSLHQLFKIARRWWWLLLLGPLVAGATAYWAMSRQAPLYSATATLVINQSESSTANELSGLQAGERLAATYERLVVTDPVLQAVDERLGLPGDVADLRDDVSASAVDGTLLLRVSVSDPDPERAALIANAVAEEFVNYVVTTSAKISGAARDALNQQIATTEARIADLNAQIETLEQGEDAGSAEVQSQLASLRASLNQAQISYNDLLVRQQEMELNEAGTQNRVTVAENARVPTDPYAPRTVLYTVLAILAGLMIAAAGVVLIEYLDNTVKADSKFEELVGAPLLTAIGVVAKPKPGRDQLFILDKPNSQVAEAVRLLRTNIEFAAASKEIRSLGVTSAGPAEGKSTVSANLAVAMAQAGFSVAIIDADLRRPSQHRIFGVRNDRGLTTLLTHPDQHWRWAAADVAVPGLTLVPSGPIPPNPADLLGLDRFRNLLKQLTQDVDVVLVDTPPVLAVSDPLVVAPQTDGVVFVCQANRTKLDALRRTSRQLQQVGVRVVGVVLNQQRGRGAESYYYYGYYGEDRPSGKGRDPVEGRVTPPADRPAEQPAATSASVH